MSDCQQQGSCGYAKPLGLYRNQTRKQGGVLSQNAPIQTVSKYMGHSDSTVILEVYSHFIPDTQEKAVLALNNLTK